MLYAQATHCFEGLMEISLNTDAVTDFAKRNELDIKYLVDGANFVISKMHFNPEEDFYVTLGLPRNATPEEIRQRWKNLMLLYHPDKQEGDEEWVAERAKKVNEAYTTLKDDSRRSEYDRKHSEAKVNRRNPSHAHTSHTSGARREKPSRAFAHSTRSSYSEPSAWDRFRTYLPKAMIGIYALAAGIFLMYIYEQNRSASLETELLAHAPQPAQPALQEQGPVVAPPPEYVTERQMEKQAGAGQKEEKIVVPSARTAEGHSSFVAPGNRAAAKAATGPKDAGNPVPPAAAPAPQAGKQVSLFSSLFSSSPSKDIQEQKPAPELKPVEQQKNPEPLKQPVRQEAAPPVQTEVKAEQPQQPKDEAVTKEEVDEFMKRYIKAYTQNDLEGFMSLFSRSAVENNTMGYQDIRNAYRETFREKINYYKIENMEIKPEGQKATVSGNYIVNRYISVEDRWVKHTGKITWRLARENSQLKIVGTNYDK